MMASIAAPPQLLMNVDERRRLLARRVALFFAILLSGGNLAFPRLPMLAAMMLICFALQNPLGMFRKEFGRIWWFLLIVAAVAILGAGGLRLDVLAIRYANFVGAIALLTLYVSRDRNQLALDLAPIFRFFAIQAILTVALALVVPGLFQPWFVQDTPYYTIGYIFTYHDFLGLQGGLRRPDGFFFEPGVLQMYLSLYLFCALFVLKRRALDVGLSLTALLLTQSTTGVVIAVVLLASAYLDYLRTARANQVLAILVLVPVLLLPFLLLAQGNLQEKFFGQSRGSAWARQYDLFTGVAVIKERPFTGIGFDYRDYYETAARVGYRETQLSTENITERGNSNGIITLFYTIGIPLGLVLVWGLWRQRFFSKRWMLFPVIVLSLLSEALAYTPFVLMIIFSGLLTQRRLRLPAPVAVGTRSIAGA